MKQARPKRIALSGYYGFRNAGDEAVLAGLVRGFRSLPAGSADKLDITALSINPAATKAEHGIKASHRYKVGPLVRTLAWCDLLASGGGSLLQDVTSKHSIFYYLGVIRAAQILGKKTMFIAQGIGPLTLPRSRRLTAATANRCSAIAVRDASSAALLREIGVHRPIETTADPALLLGMHPPSQPGSGAAISLRSWKAAPDDLPMQIAKACAERVGAQSIASMLMSPDDSEVHGHFFNDFNTCLGITTAQRQYGDQTWNTLSGIAASTTMVIGMRLHALILAVANGVPAVALSYDPKIDAFMAQTGQTDAVFDIRSADYDKLSETMARVWEQRYDRANRLQTALPALKSAALQNAQIALSLL